MDAPFVLDTTTILVALGAVLTGVMLIANAATGVYLAPNDDAPIPPEQGTPGAAGP